MLKHLLAAVLALFAVTAFAAVDVNRATQADLESVPGIGPAIAGKILDERKKGSFKDWGDLVERVTGIGEANAAKLSAGGVTVGGAAYKGGAPAGTKDGTALGDKKAAGNPDDAASRPAAKK